MIEKPNGRSYYLQLADYLIEKIKSGEFAAGEKLPSETELSRQFNINRYTVRQAMARVTNLGWISTHKGKGSYVVQRPETILYKLSARTSFTQNMQGIGRKHTGRLIRWQKIVPSSEIRLVLDLGPEEKVYELEILRSIDGIPLTVDTSNLPEKLMPGLEAHLEDFTSLTKILSEVYNIESIRVWELVEASLVRPEDALLLNMSDDSPVLLTERLCRTAEGIPLEFAVGRMASGFGKIMLEFSNS